MQNQSLGEAVAARASRAGKAAMAFTLAALLGRRAPRRLRLNRESAVRRSLVGAKGLRP